ncbi:MAG: response regulator [Candidatus Marinimicrobia bacterium]|nr:response regulator [Candidatus Neomarinimicrobiota bacterium]
MNTIGSKSVLVVEDDFASRQYLLLLLKKLEYSAFAAETGEQALELMRGKSVDIMLLDIALGPGISGLELGSTLKQKNRFESTPMVAVTAFSKDKLATLDEAGFADYMSKPYTIVELKAMLEKYLG